MDSSTQHTKISFFGEGSCSKPNHYIHFAIFLIFASITSTWAQEEVGDTCVFDDPDVPEDGICRPLRQCPYLAAQPWIYNGAGPKTPGLCFYRKSLGPVVCCPTETKTRTNFEPQPPNFGVEPPNLPPSTYEGSSGEKTSVQLRISERMCQEYEKEVDRCVKLPKPVAFIVGGYRAREGEYPHMAALGYMQSLTVSWRCGGTLISHSYIMTAAHCTKADFGRLIVARLGKLFTEPVPWSTLITSARSRIGADGDHPIDNVFKHPDYKINSAYNDIALVHLLEPIRSFDQLVRPACLYTDPEVNGFNSAEATGWGYTEAGGDNIDVRPLLQVDLKLYDSRICSKEYEVESRKSTLFRGIDEGMLCAGELDGGKDTCQGDSGGPLQVRNATSGCLYRVIGITSVGKACGLPSVAIYTRVSSYIPWIESIVWPEGK